MKKEKVDTGTKKTIIMYLFFIMMSGALVAKAQDSIPYEIPMIVEDPANNFRYAEQNRKFSGISSMAITKSGRMWATWYAGITPGEDTNNYVVVATSDDGDNWEEVFVIDPDGKGPIRAFDPELWIDPDNNLWVFWAQSNVNYSTSDYGVWAMKTTDVDNKKASWSSPLRISDGVMMCKPTVLSSGEWLLPVSTWRWKDNSAQVVISNDNGQSWQLQGAVHVPKSDREFDEHMVLERKDGSLWMLVRTNYGIGESVSKDKGKTWGDLVPSKIAHTSSRFFISRLKSGNVLLVKHGPIDVKTARSHLMAFISKDDGKTWSKGLLLDERLGISYPDGQQTEDGRIHITYDFSRTRDQVIHLTSFTEDNILSEDTDKMIYEAFRNRKTISKGGN